MFAVSFFPGGPFGTRLGRSVHSFEMKLPPFRVYALRGSEVKTPKAMPDFNRTKKSTAICAHEYLEQPN
jgi:hypothetical protein